MIIDPEKLLKLVEEEETQGPHGKSKRRTVYAGPVIILTILGLIIGLLWYQGVTITDLLHLSRTK